MDPARFRAQVKDWLGIELTPAQGDAFFTYLDLLLRWNQRMNLTAHRTPERVVVYHFLDALSLVKALGPLDDLHLVDVGTGAGFPGLPLKLVFPALRLTLLESSQKTARFLETVLEALGLDDVRLVVERAERAAHTPEHREAYDLAVARGVAPMPTLAEYLLPFARIGGRAVAYKGPKAPQEVWEARKALETLGGALERIVPVEVPGLPARRMLVCMRKERPTPPRYPRKPGIPAKRPL